MCYVFENMMAFVESVQSFCHASPKLLLDCFKALAKSVHSFRVYLLHSATLRVVNIVFTLRKVALYCYVVFCYAQSSPTKAA